MIHTQEHIYDMLSAGVWVVTIHDLEYGEGQAVSINCRKNVIPYVQKIKDEGTHDVDAITRISTGSIMHPIDVESYNVLSALDGYLISDEQTRLEREEERRETKEDHIYNRWKEGRVQLGGQS